MRRALNKWNVALKSEVYQLNLQRESVDAIDCMTTRSLCFKREGREDNLGWIGWGGLTGLNFDPLSGEILGGLITIQNLSEGGLIPTPPQVLKDINAGLTVDQVIQIQLRKEEFKKYAHAFPEELIEYVILYEIGHANGLKHDFRGSLSGTPNHPSDTVMEYLPFIVAPKLNYLGAKDLERLDVEYGRKAP